MASWKIGDVTIHRIPEILAPIDPTMLIPDATPDNLRPMHAWLKPHFLNDDNTIPLSIHAFLIEAHGARILVDTCIGNDKPRANPHWNLRQGDFLQQLEQLAAPRDSVDFVLCTHLHVDHVGWNTMLEGGKWVPTFPRARYLFGRKEWEFWENETDPFGPQAKSDSILPRRKPLTAEKIAEVVHLTLHTKPPNATHWSVRTMAAAAGLSASSIQRIWSAHGLKPHLVKTFKLSRDPNFAAKVQDVVGLYLDPPERALVLSLDEKSQIQALDRTQPGLPMKKGRAGTWTHDYKRHGVTTLFAALDVATGKVIGQCMPRHRHQEWLKFLRAIDRATPKGLDLHLIADNYATHKHPTVKVWLAKHPRFHMHFTPTSASWLNQVERFFGRITDERIRRGAFTSVADLESAITDYLDQHNAQPKPFAWTKSAGEILEKVARAKQASESQH